MLELSQSPLVVSDELVRRLTDLQLCRPADFRRARSRVRLLARDLPAFDSVWIDALVQLRRLTPYQARVLDSGDADQLRIGPYLIVDQLGHGPNGTTYVARQSRRTGQCVLKRLDVAAETIAACRNRLQKIQHLSDGLMHPHVVVPHPMTHDSDQGIVTVSRWVRGLTLGELLVRRGRLPHGIVMDIARQLGSGLAALHALGLAHGDIRLSNVRLTENGQAVLVDAGLRSVVCPELTIHDTLALEAYDSTAPELIGTGETVNAGTDMYALGCLLWQLLTGRPPYPMADALMKMAAHQTQRIADVRVWAPETPASVAELIYSMTSPIPNQRPRSLDDVLSRLGRPGSGCRARLARYRRTFDGAVPHLAQPNEATTDNRWPWMAVCLMIVAGGAFALSDRGMKSEIMAISMRVANSFQSSGSGSTTAETNSSNSSTSGSESKGLLPLPDHQANGEILLTELGPYDVDERRFPTGHLTIRSAPGVHAVIRTGPRALSLEAESIRLMDVTFDGSGESSSGHAPAMLLLKAQHVVIQNCVLEKKPHEGESASTQRERPVIAWTKLRHAASGDALGEGQIELRDSICRANGPIFWFAEAPSRVEVSNSLKVGAGACFAIYHKAASHPISFELTRLTLRESGPLLRAAGEFAELENAPPIAVTTVDCVFALASKEHGLFEFQSATPRPDLKQAIKLTGKGTIVPEAIPMVTTIEPGQADRPTAVSDADEQFEGLVATESEFAGPADGQPSNSQLIQMTAPRTSVVLPGVDTGKLPDVQRH